MFKKIIKKLIACGDSYEVNRVCCEIDRAFDDEKISFKDHETLLDLAVKIDPNIWRPNVLHIEKLD